MFKFNVPFKKTNKTFRLLWYNRKSRARSLGGLPVCDGDNDCGPDIYWKFNSVLGEGAWDETHTNCTDDTGRRVCQGDYIFQCDNGKCISRGNFIRKIKTSKLSSATEKMTVETDRTRAPSTSAGTALAQMRNSIASRTPTWPSRSTNAFLKCGYAMAT